MHSDSAILYVCSTMAEDLLNIHLSLCVGIHNADELSLAFSKPSSPERVSQCKWEREGRE